MDLNIHAQLPRRKDFRIGVVGSGFIVNDCHLVAYRKVGFNPVAIASRNRASAAAVAARHGIPCVHATVDDLLADPAIEVLDLAVPPAAQFDIIRAACERKLVKGILAQKPLGVNLAEAVEAVRLCEAAGIVLAVNQNMRYDQSVRAAHTLLRNGTIGQPVFASIDMRGIPHWMPWQKDLGWVTLRIMSIHHLDTFRYWFGTPERIFCSTRTDPRTQFPHSDGICTYVLEYANSAGANDGLRCVGIDDTWTGPAKEGCPADIAIRWRIEGLNGLATGDIGWCRDPYTTPSRLRYATKGDAQFHAPEWSESWFPDAFIGTMAQLLVALETGQPPEISGRDNLETMALVEAAYQSAATHRAVEVRALLEEPTRSGWPWPLGNLSRGSAEIVRPVNRLTPRARKVLEVAGHLAAQSGDASVRAEHVLLGLLNQGQGAACNVLRKSKIDEQMILARLRESKERNKTKEELATRPLQQVERLLTIAAREADALNFTYIGTENLLAALLKSEDESITSLFQTLGVDSKLLIDLVLQELGTTRRE